MCRFFFKQKFKSARILKIKKYIVNELFFFLFADINPKLEYLYGTAVVVWNSDKQRKDIVSFPESKLSDNIVERFNQLFKIKNRWTAEEIKPYIS